MSIVSATLYRKGEPVKSLTIDEPMPCPTDESEFVWIGLFEPSEDEIYKLQKHYQLHPLAVEDALQAHQLPKIDVYGDQLFLAARTAEFEDDKIVYGETSAFVGANHIITVRHGSARSHKALRQQLETSPSLLAQGVDFVLHAILDFIVDGYVPVVEEIEEAVLEIERRALDTLLARQDVRRIFNLRRELIRFQRILGPIREVAGKLVNLEMPCIDAEARPYFSDVQDHVRGVESRVDGLRDVLTSVFEISSLLEQQRTGTITRQLAAWAAILAVPTAIAGIYGMNFEHMPELTTQYGYFVVLGVITVICTILYFRFKRSGWL